jgi:hypothetical protein
MNQKVRHRGGRTWWIYTIDSWPEPAHGPYPSYDEALRAAIFVYDYDDYRIAHTTKKDAGHDEADGPH